MADFIWRVSGAGYTWRQTNKRHDRLRILATKHGQGAREYRPLTEHPLLFREFAALESNRDSCIAFANKYGHLTAGVEVVGDDGREIETHFTDEIKWPNGKMERTWLSTELKIAPKAEDDALWFHHVLQMRAAIKQWEQAGGKREGVAKTGFGKTITANLRNRVVPCFEDSGALAFSPADLLSALWLQLATAVGGGHVHKQCLHCRAWFQVAVPKTEGRRTRGDKGYCDTVCRMKAAYARRSSQ